MKFQNAIRMGLEDPYRFFSKMAPVAMLEVLILIFKLTSKKGV